MSFRLFLSLFALLVAGWMAVPQTALAQYAPPGYGRDYYDDRGPPRYDPREERRREEWRRQQEWERRNERRGDWDGRRGGWDDRRGPRGGRYCVTSRGSCPAVGPSGGACRCEIPGFGRKRGIIQ
ncbi:hypothetical protein [Chelatococcus asaccharovorans]|uniref:Uncharacterized protein n=1 Tax=Chelatococcus asaccharovorans TaxID=28210 RepID=A0A2V3TZ15_9HYPH|nr:hypothetical protein [Chelatococcus asaccharovorans]MBS7704797.1 hypothetical protein [Chelatococcus asaccharovorans]PXW54694.1 hypothetical protein C7450_111226 [Chelatococcus asaccharovorans]CAH1650218.1 Eukaryotic translation initiation factor 4B [Chelatococcus asaccharovorans]CAH1686796.1 Eukaryotic translation initiation factor 4B [Chelatococcus asaccharovorans]